MTYTVLMADGELRLRWPRQSDLVLEPVDGDRFVSCPWTMMFTRSEAGAVNGLALAARRLRRLRAERLMEQHPSCLVSSGRRCARRTTFT